MNGIQVSGTVRGAVIVGNTITGHAANGLLLNAAQDLLVGGTLSAMGNTVVTNVGYGLLAVGSCTRTQVIRNPIAGNSEGDVNLSSSTGITYVPASIPG